MVNINLYIQGDMMDKRTADGGITMKCYVENSKDSIFKSRTFCIEKARPAVIAVSECHNSLMVINDE